MRKTWQVLIPDWSGYDDIWRSPAPYCLWPVGNQPLVSHWMDHAVERGIEQVDFFTADRPAEVRNFLGNGDYWSRAACVHPIASDDYAPQDAIPLLGLPNCNRVVEPFERTGDLHRLWLKTNRLWLESMDGGQLRIETKHPSGGWIGPHARIHRSAELVAPFWIRGRCQIGPKARIGPNVCLGENTIIDEGASVRDSVVLSGTMVGRHTSLEQVAVEGGLLLDGKNRCRVAISDSFILSNIAGSLQATSIFERMVALAIYLFFSPVVALSRIDWTLLEVHDGQGGTLRLKTGQGGGWLVARRWHWLKEVARGRMRLIGILPRPLQWKLDTDPEVEQRLKETLPGFIALSDLHGCHGTDDPDEWLHASYQALKVDRNVSKLIRNRFWKLAFNRNANYA